MNKLDKWLWGIENRMYSGVVMFTREVKVLYALYKKAVKELELKQQQIENLSGLGLEVTAELAIAQERIKELEEVDDMTAEGIEKRRKKHLEIGRKFKEKTDDKKKVSN